MTRELERAYLHGHTGPALPPQPTQVGARQLAVLIVAYKNPDLLETCLRAVETHLTDVRTLVWDNSGLDYPGMAEVIARHPDIAWSLGSANIGFAAAVNALAAQASDCDLLLLNPDAVLLGPLDGTRAAIASHGVAAAAPLVIDAQDATDSARPWDVAHRDRGLVRALVSKAGYAEKLRRTGLSDLYPAPPAAVEGYLTGACLAISRAAWTAVGPFDEEFFLYGEETDWQHRARSAGWQLKLIDERGVEHTGHGTVAGDPIAGMRSRDLLRANIALNLELNGNVHKADVYLAGTSLLDRVQRSARKERAARRRKGSAKPSVIITTNRLVYGGAERQHVLLGAELDRRGYEVVIACMQRFGPLVAEVPSSIRVVRQPWWVPAIDIGDGKSVLVTGDTNTETGFATLWRRGGKQRRWLVGSHIPPEVDGPTYSRGLAAAMRRADGFVALSPRHWEEANEYQCVGRRHFVAPNGVESVTALEQVASRPPVGDVPKLVMLSRIVEHKNPHLLVEALDGLRELPWDLSIFGDGPDRERLEALTPSDLRDRVHWRGWSPGPEAALADCDLLCVPSRSEAFPLVILEAMARRIPVIASSVCAVPDMLDQGRAGALVEDITVDGWRRALRGLLEQPQTWPALGDRGFDRMRERYTIEAMADAYEAAIAGVFA
ncbi:glycosyltransferase [Antrihabitans sp. YC3-6]|uniref:Glycosyltransferase n=1 Tax=Antrihabitans stalagmiti TaxID=2799499 RepID=A0A934NS45_9NOCA|nr:glycosyltransferase [Antrihabitans stalagmiti]MBJ8340468.1 glycosyltransferase [Antrihabitans stalagmiti]